MRLAVLPLVLLLASVPAAWAGIVEDCAQTADPDLSIGSCTALIRSGKLTGKSLAPVYTFRGVAWEKLGKPARAVEDFNQALRIVPQDAIIYYNRGNAYFAHGKYDRAIEDYDQAIRLDPEFAPAYFERGEVRFDLALGWGDLSNYSHAIRDYDQAIRLDPEYADAYYRRGFAYIKLGKYHRGASDWEREMKIKGTGTIRRWQNCLTSWGHYSGAIDGVYNPDIKAGLIACMYDPECVWLGK